MADRLYTVFHTNKLKPYYIPQLPIIANSTRDFVCKHELRIMEMHASLLYIKYNYSTKSANFMISPVSKD